MASPKMILVAEGVAVLVAGSVTVAEPRVSVTDSILLDMDTPGGGIGAKFISAVTDATDFTIDSTDGTETSTIRWRILRPAQGI